MGKLLIISNRLPVSLTKDLNIYRYTRSSGGLASSLTSVYQKNKSTWVGWPGMEVGLEEQDQISQELSQDKMHPVFISRECINGYYEGFCNGTIWPLFHYFPWLTRFSQKDWEAYVLVNQLFFNEILKVADKQDTIWIHDYHLFLLPSLLRARFPKSTIGFFLHIPFPSYELFRMLPWREEILHGLLGANLIGFQTNDDKSHFLQTITQVIHLPNTDGYLEVNERLIKAGTFPISIDYQLYEQVVQQTEVINKVQDLRKSFLNRKLILSVDRLDLSKGIPEKLHSYELFLNNNPQWRGMHHLILLVVPSRTEVENYKKLKWHIEQEVGRINGKYGHMTWTPIRYMFTSLPLEALSALYKIADVALITPLRDGMNLVAKEYIASKTDGLGVLILSEMAGASKELTNAIIINPHDCPQVAKAIHTAITMLPEEQVKRNRQMQQQINKNNVHQWAGSFLTELNAIKQHQPLSMSK